MGSPGYIMLAMGKYVYQYPRPAVTVDVAACRLVGEALTVLLIRRGKPPFQGRWALPGGFMGIDEPPEAAAKRELAEETALSGRAILWEQIGAFGQVDRDPRGRTISIAYLALYKNVPDHPTAGDDAAEAAWFDVSRLPALAFDHSRIIAAALQRLRWKLCCTPTAFRLAGRTFTLQGLRHVFEVLLGGPVDKRRFAQKILKEGLIEPTGRRTGGSRTYRLVRNAGRRKFVLGIDRCG